MARVFGPGENVEAYSKDASAASQRQHLVAPEFRGLRVIHEMLMVADAEENSRGPQGYPDPVTMSGGERLFGHGLPKEFGETSRGGYRFDFIGKEAASVFHEVDDESENRAPIPRYVSYVYVATPESDATGPYTFALHSEDGLIHYTKDGRTPSVLDPSVSDGVDYASEGTSAPASAPGRPGLLSRLWGGITGLQHRIGGSGTDAGSDSEERVINDLRAFASAEELFFNTFGARGYGSVEALTNPGSLEGVPESAPFVSQAFTHDVRYGYRFTFVGEQETEGGQPRLYRNYGYVAIPVGDGPASRRSFAVYDDNVVRARTDSAPPTEIDPALK